MSATPTDGRWLSQAVLILPWVLAALLAGRYLYHSLIFAEQLRRLGSF